MMAMAVFALVLVPVATAAIIWLLKPRVAGLLAVAACVLMLVAALALFVRVQDHGPQTTLGDWIYIDPLSAIVLILITVVGVCGALNSRPYIAHDIASGELRTYTVGRGRRTTYDWCDEFISKREAA